MPQPDVPRRTVVSAAAWALPPIAVATAAPARAASPSQNASITFEPRQLVSVRRPSTTRAEAIFYTTTYGASYRSSTESSLTSYAWTGTTTATTISDVRLVMYFAVNNLTFQNGPNHSSCWTRLVRDASVQNATHSSGATLYAYTSRYTCPITAQDTRTQLAAFEWDTRTVAAMNSSTYQYWGREVSYTLNGVPMTSRMLSGQVS